MAFSSGGSSYLNVVNGAIARLKNNVMQDEIFKVTPHFPIIYSEESDTQLMYVQDGEENDEKCSLPLIN